MSVLGGGSTATNVELVRELAHGRWKAQALAVALRLGVADVLADGVMSAGELASRLEVSEDGLRRLLRLMVALGVFEDAGEDGYRNNAASELLRADHPDTLRPFALRVLSTEYPLVARRSSDRIATP
ncbi:MAG TPA: methyltransferase dimerization domain-containing protein [Terriglobales bacterium]|nr:methyltransferase dimerization domain-containing protein [Terriglobales bacterium]